MIDLGGGALRARARGIDRWLGAMLLVSLALLAAGLFLPAITVRSLALFSRDYSLAESVWGFLVGGDVFLFVVMATFTLIFPTFKILAGLAIWYAPAGSAPAGGRLLAALAALSKWSMLDVFIVAVVVLVADARLLTSADADLGLVAFAAAVLTSTFAVRRLSSLAAH